MSDVFSIVRVFLIGLHSFLYYFFIGSEHYLGSIIFEDDEKKLLNLEGPLPNYTALGLRSSASAPSASNLPSGIKSSGIIFNVYFSFFFLLKISYTFLVNTVLLLLYRMLCNANELISQSSVFLDSIINNGFVYVHW